MKVQFVWMPGFSRPTPQIWFGDMKTDKERKQPLARWVLPEHHRDLAFDELVKIYPYQTEVKEDGQETGEH